MQTAEQLKAARAMVDLTRVQLAKLADLSPETVKRLENQTGNLAGNTTTIAAIVEAFAGLGVTFLNKGDNATGPAVSLAEPSGK